jgi:hypothetical protein
VDPCSTPNYTYEEYLEMGVEGTYEDYISRNLSKINRLPKNLLFSDYGAPLHSPEEKTTRDQQAQYLFLSPAIEDSLAAILSTLCDYVPTLALNLLRQRYRKHQKDTKRKLLNIDFFEPKTLTELYILKKYLHRSTPIDIENMWFPDANLYSVIHKDGLVILSDADKRSYLIDVLDYTSPHI